MRWIIGGALGTIILATFAVLSLAVGQQSPPVATPGQATPPQRPATQPPGGSAQRSGAPAAPAAAPGPQVPAATQAPAAAGAPGAQTGGAGHVLAGAWRVQWPVRNAMNTLTVDAVQAFQGGVQVTGIFVADNNERCALSGTVFDQFGAPVREGLDTRMITVSALVRFRIQCQQYETWIEALGLPTGPILMAGRGTRLTASAAPSYEPVVLGRP